MAPEASVQGKQTCAVTLDLPVSPDFRVVVCSIRAVLCWVQGKLFVFSLFSCICCGKDRSDDFQAPYMFGLKLEVRAMLLLPYGFKDYLYTQELFISTLDFFLMFILWFSIHQFDSQTCFFCVFCFWLIALNLWDSVTDNVMCLNYVVQDRLKIGRLSLTLPFSSSSKINVTKCCCVYLWQLLNFSVFFPS